MGGVADPRELVSARQNLEMALAPLELQLLGRAHLLGEFSLADIAYAPTFANLAAATWDLAPWPNVRAWTSSVLARPAWAQATQA